MAQKKDINDRTPHHPRPEELTNPITRSQYLFYTNNSMSKLPMLLYVFKDFLNNSGVFTSVIQHSGMPTDRKRYFLERIIASTPTKWTLLFKHIVRFYRWEDEVGDFLYQGFCEAGLQQKYMYLVTQNKFLYPIGKHSDTKKFPPNV